jgi:hypothetical protein
MSFSKCTSICRGHIPLDNVSILASETPTGVSQNALPFAEDTFPVDNVPSRCTKTFLYNVDFIPSLLID